MKPLNDNCLYPTPNIRVFMFAFANSCHIYGISANYSQSSSAGGGGGGFLDPIYVQAIAGRIVPAVISTTAVTAGLATIELVKLARAAAARAAEGQQERQKGVHARFARFGGMKLDMFKNLFCRIRRDIVKLVPFQLRSYVGLFPPLTSTLELRGSRLMGRVAKAPLTHLRSSFVNLATPSITSAEPVLASTAEIPTTDESFSKWDVIEVIVVSLIYLSYLKL